MMRGNDFIVYSSGYSSDQTLTQTIEISVSVCAKDIIGRCYIDIICRCFLC